MWTWIIQCCSEETKERKSKSKRVHICSEGLIVNFRLSSKKELDLWCEYQKSENQQMSREIFWSESAGFRSYSKRNSFFMLRKQGRVDGGNVLPKLTKREINLAEASVHVCQQICVTWQSKQNVKSKRLIKKSHFTVLCV